MPLILVPVLLLGLPLLEIGVFIWVGGHIGVGWTLALVLLSMVAGALLLRRQTFSNLTAARDATRGGRLPAREIVHGAMIVMAGLLLIVPGFITDIVGILLFLPPVRDLLWRLLQSRIRIVAAGGPRTQTYEARRPGPEMIDLTRTDFTRRESDNSPWRRADGEERSRNPKDRDEPTLH